MASLQDTLKARQDAINAAKVAGAIPGGGKPDQVGEAPELNMATGIQSSEAMASGPQAPSMIPVGEVDPKKADLSKAVFKTLTLRQFFDRSGVKIKHEDGFFYAIDDEALGMLRHYASIGKVEEITK